MTIVQFRALTFAWGLVLLAAGCGGPSGPAITGQVKLDGQPLAKARVAFSSLDKIGGAYAKAVCNDEGRFVVEPDALGMTLPPGKYAVTVSLKKNAQGQIPADADYDMEEMGGTLTESIPTKYTFYNSVEEVAVSADVKPGKNDFTFELSSK
jgi:hypothetical protein